jgi:hypothetical protein
MCFVFHCHTMCCMCMYHLFVCYSSISFKFLTVGRIFMSSFLTRFEVHTLVTAHHCFLGCDAMRFHR